MMVLPAINCESFECVRERIQIVNDFSEWIHIDITDAKFTSRKTWNNVGEFFLLKEKYPNKKFEIHLMVEDVETAFFEWSRAKPEQIIIPFKTLKDSIAILERAKNYDIVVVLGLTVDDDLERVKTHKDDFINYQVLAVMPGFSNQEFNIEAIEVIKNIRNFSQFALIEVDGGVNEKTIRLLKEAGANSVASASFIFDNVSPKLAYEILLNS